MAGAVKKSYIQKQELLDGLCCAVILSVLIPTRAFPYNYFMTTLV